MEKFFTDLWAALQGYWYQAQLQDYWYQLLLLLVIGSVLLWLLSFILVHLARSDREHWLKAFVLYRNWFLASTILSAVTIGIIASLDCSSRNQDFIFNSNAFSKFNLLMLLVYASGVAAFRYWRWTKTLGKNQLHEVAGVAITANSREIAYLFLKRQINNWRWILLLPLLSFLLILPCLLKKEKVFLAIVLDTSTSMNEPIANGKQVLAEALYQLNVECEYLITTLQPGTVTNMLELMRETDPKKIAGISRAFSSTPEAIDYIASDRVKAENPDSPIAEAIWKTYLTATTSEMILSGNYQKRALIVVSDGGDNVKELNTFFCFDDNFNEFFSPEDVLMVDVHKAEDELVASPFFNASQECGYVVGSGSDYDSYSNAVMSLIGSISKKPPFWTIWASLVFVLTSLLVLIISPSKLQ